METYLDACIITTPLVKHIYLQYISYLQYCILSKNKKQKQGYLFEPKHPNTCHYAFSLNAHS